MSEGPEELSAPLQELWDVYRAAMREAHRQGIAQLFSTKDTVNRSLWEQAIRCSLPMIKILQERRKRKP